MKDVEVKTSETVYDEEEKTFYKTEEVEKTRTENRTREITETIMVPVTKEKKVTKQRPVQKTIYEDVEKTRDVKKTIYEEVEKTRDITTYKTVTKTALKWKKVTVDASCDDQEDKKHGWAKESESEDEDCGQKTIWKKIPVKKTKKIPVTTQEKYTAKVPKVIIEQEKYTEKVPKTVTEYVEYEDVEKINVMEPKEVTKYETYTVEVPYTDRVSVPVKKIVKTPRIVVKTETKQVPVQVVKRIPKTKTRKVAKKRLEDAKTQTIKVNRNDSSRLADKSVAVQKATTKDRKVIRKVPREVEVERTRRVYEDVNADQSYEAKFQGTKTLNQTLLRQKGTTRYHSNRGYYPGLDSDSESEIEEETLLASESEAEEEASAGKAEEEASADEAEEEASADDAEEEASADDAEEEEASESEAEEEASADEEENNNSGKSYRKGYKWW